MKIMSYNINCFKGKKGPLTNMSENIHKISSFIKGFLIADKENLVILQELPKRNSKIYNQIMNFDKNKFIFMYPIKANNSYFITVAIANKDSSWEQIQKEKGF